MFHVLFTAFVLIERISIANSYLRGVSRIPISVKSTVKTHTIHENEDGHRRALTGTFTTQLEVGETIYETIQATTPTIPPQTLDICLLQDVTYTLTSEIELLQGQTKNNMYDSITGYIADTQFAVAAFADYPRQVYPAGYNWPYSRNDDFAYYLSSSMSSSKSDWVAGIDRLKKMGGGEEDAQYDAIVAAAGDDDDPNFSFNDPTKGEQASCGWRINPRADDRVLIVMTDLRYLKGFHPNGDGIHMNDHTSTVAALNKQNIKVIGLKQAPSADNQDLERLTAATGGITKKVEYGALAEYTTNTMDALYSIVPLATEFDLTWDVTSTNPLSDYLNISLNTEVLQDVALGQTYAFNASVSIKPDAPVNDGDQLKATVNFYIGTALIHDVEFVVEVTQTSTSTSPTILTTASTSPGEKILTTTTVPTTIATTSATSTTTIPNTIPFGNIDLSPNYTLGICQGDCDSDADCVAGLICYNTYEEDVPGCSGTRKPNWAYCSVAPATTSSATSVTSATTMDPTTSSTTSATSTVTTPDVKILTSTVSPDPPLLDIGPNPQDGTLKLCEGNCVSDTQCVSGLMCHHRNDFGKVPGCSGLGTADWNYCINAPATATSATSMTTPATTTIATTSATSTTTIPNTIPFGNIDLSPNYTLGICQGDCDSDADCVAGLICYNNYEEDVPGCSGTRKPNWAYCSIPGGKTVTTTTVPTTSASSTIVPKNTIKKIVKEYSTGVTTKTIVETVTNNITTYIEESALE